jgi:hypothetical protein
MIRRFPEKVMGWVHVGLLICAVSTACFTGVGYAIHCAAREAIITVKLAGSEKRGDDQETRLRTVEATLGALSGKIDVVQNNVQWIRDYFDPDKHGRTASVKP